jgi:hypothetical protein
MSSENFFCSKKISSSIQGRDRAISHATGGPACRFRRWNLAFTQNGFLLTHHFNNTLLAWIATSRFLTLFQLASSSPLDTTTVRFHQQASTLSNRQRLLTWSANFQGIATNTSPFTSLHQSTSTFNTTITR